MVELMGCAGKMAFSSKYKWEKERKGNKRERDSSMNE
jgi:hypothetical protein